METLKERYDYYSKCIDDAWELLGAIEHLKTPVANAVRNIIQFEEISVAEENCERLRYGIEHGRADEKDFRDGDFVADEHSIFILKEYVKNEFDEYPVVYAAYNRKNDDVFELCGELRAYHGLGLDFATDAERMLLLKKLNERGYEWNPETKELVNLNDNKE